MISSGTVTRTGRSLVPLLLMCWLLTAWLPGSLQGQDVFHVELRNIIDSPTAGLLGKGTYGTDLRLFPNGGMLANVSVGVFSRLTVGISYGGLNIIGEDDIDWYRQVGLQGKLRIYDESFVVPAIVVGFDSQGYGLYDRHLDRYEIKSKGAYLVLSKSFWMLGPLGIHAGTNYCFEDEDGDRDLSLFGGFDKDLVAGFLFLAEYDLALNDNSEDGAFGTGNGYLNVGLRWTFARKLSLELDLKNLTDNREYIPYVSREIRIIYWDFF